MQIESFHIDENASDEKTLYVDTTAGTVAISMAEEGINLSVFSRAVADGPAFEALVRYEVINDDAHVESSIVPLKGGYLEITPDGSYYFYKSHNDGAEAKDAAEVVMWDAQEIAEDRLLYSTVLNVIKTASFEGMETVARRIKPPLK